MSTTNPITPLRKAWLKWKSLRLPWRKRFLVGFDLKGNTYWEFRLLTRGTAAGPNSERWRRIVQYPRANTHLSAVRVGPLWHQWLRHVRVAPPTLDEQRQDVVRRERIKRLAAEADARWAAKPRLVQAAGGDGDGQMKRPGIEQGTAERGGSVATETKRKKDEDDVDDTADPWNKARRRGLGEDWQPQAWSPTMKK